jgi:hypothetical protein
MSSNIEENQEQFEPRLEPYPLHSTKKKEIFSYFLNLNFSDIFKKQELRKVLLKVIGYFYIPFLLFDNKWVLCSTKEEKI